MQAMTLDPTRPEFAFALAGIVIRARRLIGWTQRELADRAHTSPSTVWRLEHGRADSVETAVVSEVLGALGLNPRIVLGDRHLEDRRRQQDGVHAVVNGYVGRRLARWGWAVASEALIDDGRPLGWVDQLAFREADEAILVEETKADIPDLGATQRSLGFYERRALDVARRLGWHPRSVNVLLVTLDSAEVAGRLRDRRDLVREAFPVGVLELAAWLRDPAAPRPAGWALAACDPAYRGDRWLRPALPSTRRSAVPYADYADAAGKLLRGPG